MILLSKCFQEFNPHRKVATRGGGRIWASYNQRSQRKHVLARGLINHWNKLAGMIADFFLS